MTTNERNVVQAGFPLRLENLENRKSFSSQGNIREFENFAKYQGKIREKLFKNYFLFFMLYRALPIQMHFWETFWIFLFRVNLWCFQVAGYMGQSLLQEEGAWLMPCWAGMLLDYKKGDRASANSCPQVASSEACPHCISHLLTLPGGRLRLGGETRVSHLVRV